MSVSRKVSRRVSERLAELRTAERRDRDLFIGLLRPLVEDEGLEELGLSVDRVEDRARIYRRDSLAFVFWVEDGRIRVRRTDEESGQDVVESFDGVGSALDHLVSLMAWAIHLDERIRF